MSYLCIARKWCVRRGVIAIRVLASVCRASLCSAAELTRVIPPIVHSSSGSIHGTPVASQESNGAAIMARTKRPDGSDTRTDHCSQLHGPHRDRRYPRRQALPRQMIAGLLQEGSVYPIAQPATRAPGALLLPALWR